MKRTMSISLIFLCFLGVLLVFAVQRCSNFAGEVVEAFIPTETMPVEDFKQMSQEELWEYDGTIFVTGQTENVVNIYAFKPEGGVMYLQKGYKSVIDGSLNYGSRKRAYHSSQELYDALHPKE